MVHNLSTATTRKTARGILIYRPSFYYTLVKPRDWLVDSSLRPTTTRTFALEIDFSFFVFLFRNFPSSSIHIMYRKEMIQLQVRRKASSTLKTSSYVAQRWFSLPCKQEEILQHFVIKQLIIDNKRLAFKHLARLGREKRWRTAEVLKATKAEVWRWKFFAFITL